METITLDFTKCHYISDIYNIFSKNFNFPEYCGENLDALWDCLDGYCDYHLHVYIKGFNSLKNEFAEYKRKIEQLLYMVNRENPNMTFEIIS